MKPLADLTHYEVLEVPPDASLEEIERATAMALATYADDSLAVYSVFAEREATMIRARIELAHRILSDPEERARYDATLAAVRRAPDASPPPLRIDDERRPAAELEASTVGLEDPEDEDDFAEFSGARLRRARLRRGLELEQIAEITKINPAYLRFLEEEYHAGLPAPVYVRGFVRAYARCVGLDPEAVGPSYMQRLLVREAQQAPRRHPRR